MKHLGEIVEANVGLDEGGPEWARVVLVNDDDEAFLFHMDQGLATDFALELSTDVYRPERQD